MATTSVTVTAAAFTAVKAGAQDLYLQNKSAMNVIYRVDTTGSQGIDEDHHVLPQYAMHPVRIPSGSTLYARVQEKASDRSAVLTWTEAYLGPEG